MLKRFVDIIFSLIGLVLIFIPSIIIALLIVIDSKGGVFYIQQRVGRNSKPFGIYKFRTMKPASDSKGLLTVGSSDARITKIGYFLRKYKIDELPQLLNVFKGDMSIVGPRPEVPKYVELYTSQQKRVLEVRPGISDLASIEYMDENDILAKSENPEKTYLEEVMPAKLDLGLKYIENQSFIYDMTIILRTIKKIFKR
jgi:lipopolysaccharide/colanic/teichoic acid biosynthesis glycosyltransferase